MKDTTGHDHRKTRQRPTRDDPEMRVVGIHVKPAPDAQERLRRLYAILVKLVEDDPPSPDEGGEEED